MFKFKKILILLLVVVLMLGVFSSFSIASAAGIIEEIPEALDYTPPIVNVKTTAYEFIVHFTHNSRNEYHLYRMSERVEIQIWDKDIVIVGDGDGFEIERFHSIDHISWNTDNTMYYKSSGNGTDSAYNIGTASNFAYIDCFCNVIDRDTGEVYFTATSTPDSGITSKPEAPSTLPDGYSGNDYVLYFHRDYNVYYAMINFDPGDSSVVTKNGDKYRVNFTLTSPAIVYSYNGEWSLTNSDIDGDLFIEVYSSADIIHYPTTLTFEGEDFFVPPLTLAEAVKGGIADLLQTMAKALTILVGLAVLLMASLIGLDLFGKVLRRFLH